MDFPHCEMIVQHSPLFSHLKHLVPSFNRVFESENYVFIKTDTSKWALTQLYMIKFMIFLLIFAFPSLQTKMYSDTKLYSHFYPRICDGNFFLFPPQIFLLLLLYHHRPHCHHQLHSYWLFTISQVMHMHMHTFYSILTTNHCFYFLHFNSK